MLGRPVLTGETKIDTFRGTHIDSPFVEGLQVVPTIRLPSSRAWHGTNAPSSSLAMRKALRRYTDQDRTIYIPEPLTICKHSSATSATRFVFDVETNKSCRITEFWHRAFL